MREWDEQLRARGYRVTPQRQLVLEAVARLDHATPEEIGAQVQQTARGVNISTIYRTLELLEQIGMVTHTHLHHGAPTYHLATDADHVHLVCRDCGRVTEIGPDAIRPLITALDERTASRPTSAISPSSAAARNAGRPPMAEAKARRAFKAHRRRKATEHDE